MSPLTKSVISSQADVGFLTSDGDSNEGDGRPEVLHETGAA